MLKFKSVVKFGCFAAVTTLLMSGAASADAIMAKPGGAASTAMHFNIPTGKAENKISNRRMAMSAL